MTKKPYVHPVDEMKQIIRAQLETKPAPIKRQEWKTGFGVILLFAVLFMGAGWCLIN